MIVYTVYVYDHMAGHYDPPHYPWKTYAKRADAELEVERMKQVLGKISPYTEAAFIKDIEVIEEA